MSKANKTKQYADPFCRPLHRPGKKPIYGGAARESRLAALGGVPGVVAALDRVVEQTDAMIFEKAALRLPANVVALPRKRKAA